MKNILLSLLMSVIISFILFTSLILFLFNYDTGMAISWCSKKENVLMFLVLSLCPWMSFYAFIDRIEDKKKEK